MEIASLFAHIDSLTDLARAALGAEIRRRGISSAHLLKLREAELRGEAKFDRRQKEHVKSVASSLLRVDLLRADPKWTIAIILSLLGVALVANLMKH
jgi:hypothetical protein